MVMTMTMKMKMIKTLHKKLKKLKRFINGVKQLLKDLFIGSDENDNDND